MIDHGFVYTRVANTKYETMSEGVMYGSDG